MAITVLTPTERVIAGVKKGQAGVVNIPTLRVQDIQALRKTGTVKPTTAPSADKVTQTVTAEPRGADWLDVLSTVFPPAGIFNIGRDPVGTVRPTINTTGSPEALATYQQLTPGVTTPTAGDNGLGDVLGDVTGLLKTAVPLVLIGMVLSTVGKFKGILK